MIYVLDTNIAAAALNLHPAVTSRLAQLAPNDVGFSLIVVGELLYGARKSQRVAENLAKITNDAGLEDGTIDGLTVEDWLA